MHKANVFSKTLTLLFGVLVGASVATFFYYPFVTSSFALVPGDEGDSRFVSFILEHLYQWFNGESTFDSPVFFYPEQGTLGFSDVQLLHGIAYSIIRLFDFPPLQSFSVTIFLLNFLTYIASFAFLRFGMKLRLFPSIVGALVFSFNSAKLNQMNHTQLQPLLLIPLISWFLILTHDACVRIRSGKNIRTYVYPFFAIALFHLQLWTSFYIAWFYSIILVFGLLVLLTTSVARTYLIEFLNKNRSTILFSAVVFALFSMLFLKLYLPVLREHGGRSYGEIDSMLPRIWSYLWMGDGNYVWGGFNSPIFHSLPMSSEHRIGVGVIFTGFALLSFFWAIGAVFRVQEGRIWIHLIKFRFFPKITPRMDSSSIFLLIGSLGVLIFFTLTLRLSSGSLWASVYSVIPGASSVRAIARYALVAYFFVGIFVAVVLNQIELKKYSSSIKKGLLICLFYLFISFGVGEQFGAVSSFNTVTSMKWADSTVKKITPDCDSFYLKASSNFPRPYWAISIDAMLAAHLSGVPTINGYSGQNPLNYSLWNPKDRDILKSLEKWKRSNNIQGKVCVIQHQIPQ